MSTKTTFKRIALVTVAALGLGFMASAPSNAGTASVVQIADTTVYGFVGDTITAKVKMTVTSSADLTTTDSVTLTAAYVSKSPTNNPAIDSVSSDSSTPLVTLDDNKFKLIESATAGTSWAAVHRTSLTGLNTIELKAQSGSESATAVHVASVLLRPTAPGTYVINVTPSYSALGVAGVTYTAGKFTFVVLSAGAGTSDGGIVTPYNTAGGVAGAGNYTQVKVTGQRGTLALGTRVVVTGGVIDGSLPANTALSTDKTTLTITGSTSAAAQGLINILTPTVGTITVNSYLETAVGTYSTTASNTVTITVRATAQAGTPSYNEVYMALGETTVPTAVTDAAIVAAASVPSKTYLSDSAGVARIQVNQFDVLEAAASTSKTLAVTAEISGAGRIGLTDDAVGSTSIIAIAAGSVAAPQSATADFFIFSDGRPGVGTVVIKVGGVVALTRTVSFTGVETSLKLVAATATVPNPSKSYLAVGGTMTISVLPYDQLGTKMSAVSVFATSETATVASVLSTSYASGVVTVTGVAVGKNNITICYGACATSTVKMVVPVEVTKSTGVAKLTLDKTSAQSGEKVTWTITATDVNGRPTADGISVPLFSAVSANMTVSGGALPTGTETLTAGVATGFFYAPTAGSGTLTITATQGTSHDTYIAGLKAATAAGTTYTAVKDVVSLTIANAAADAAQAAAEEATAAANDATDAALSAAEAAEAATAMAQEAVDAVAELSASVTKLISALRAQITTLTNLVVKIQKKVRA